VTSKQPRVGPYTILRPLARGGSSHVFVAQRDGEEQVLKLPIKPEGRRAILDESRRLTTMASPHLPRATGAARDGSWMGMEYVAGLPWHRAAEDQTIEQILGIALEVLHPLRVLHRKGFAHGDLKPEHVVIDSWGHAKVLDCMSSEEERGTIGFAAPERLSSAEVTPQADMYAFGATLYAALTGHTPYATVDPKAAITLPVERAPLPPSAYRTDVPANIDRLVHKLLRIDPAQRPTVDATIQEIAVSHRSARTKPFVGMVAPRTQLYRAVRAAQTSPQVVVVYGPQGSGRRSMAQDAAKIAQLEGFQLMDAASPGDFLSALQARKRPMAIRGAQRKGAATLGVRLLEGDKPGLLMLYAQRPIPVLADAGAVHISPAPLTEAEVECLALWAGLDTGLVPSILRESQGRPLHVMAVLHRLRPPEVRARKMLQMTPLAQRILAILKRDGEASVEAIARELQVDALIITNQASFLERSKQLISKKRGRSFSLP